TPNKWALTMAARSTAGAAGAMSGAGPPEPSSAEPRARHARAASWAAMATARTTVTIEGAAAARPRAPPSGRRHGATIRSTSCIRSGPRIRGGTRDMIRVAGAHPQGGKRPEIEVTTGTCATLLILGSHLVSPFGECRTRHLCGGQADPINEAKAKDGLKAVAKDKDREIGQGGL